MPRSSSSLSVSRPIAGASNINGSDARYVQIDQASYLVYAVSGNVYAVRFDPNRLVTNGSPVLLQAGVRLAGGSFTGAANFDVSDDGTFIYVPGPASPTIGKMEVAVEDLVAQTVTPLKMPADAYESIRVAPDGIAHRIWERAGQGMDRLHLRAVRQRLDPAADVRWQQ